MLTDLEKAMSVPCPACKMAAEQKCVALDTGARVEGVHSTRIYRAYVVAEADAHNRAVELEAEVERLRASTSQDAVVAVLKKHYAECTLMHPGNDAWHECEARAIAAAIQKGQS